MRRARVRRGRPSGADRRGVQAAAPARRRAARGRSAGPRGDPPRPCGPDIRPLQVRLRAWTPTRARRRWPTPSTPSSPTRGVTPFTTPGHKRAPGLADGVLAHDLPLSAGADDLHLTSDVLGRAERLAARALGRRSLPSSASTARRRATRRWPSPSARPGDRVVVAAAPPQVAVRGARARRARPRLGAARRRRGDRPRPRRPGRPASRRRWPRQPTRGRSSSSSRTSWAC